MMADTTILQSGRTVGHVLTGTACTGAPMSTVGCGLDSDGRDRYCVWTWFGLGIPGCHGCRWLSGKSSCHGTFGQRASKARGCRFDSCPTPSPHGRHKRQVQNAARRERCSVTGLTIAPGGSHVPDVYGSRLSVSRTLTARKDGHSQKIPTPGSIH